jgi:hypothetical protein
MTQVGRLKRLASTIDGQFIPQSVILLPIAVGSPQTAASFHVFMFEYVTVVRVLPGK